MEKQIPRAMNRSRNDKRSRNPHFCQRRAEMGHPGRSNRERGLYDDSSFDFEPGDGGAVGAAHGDDLLEGSEVRISEESAAAFVHGVGAEFPADVLHLFGLVLNSKEAIGTTRVPTY